MFLKMSCLREESVLFETNIFESALVKTSTVFLRRYHNRIIGNNPERNIDTHTGQLFHRKSIIDLHLLKYFEKGRDCIKNCSWQKYSMDTKLMKVVSMCCF